MADLRDKMDIIYLKTTPENRLFDTVEVGTGKVTNTEEGDAWTAHCRKAAQVIADAHYDLPTTQATRQAWAYDQDIEGHARALHAEEIDDNITQIVEHSAGSLFEARHNDTVVGVALLHKMKPGYGPASETEVDILDKPVRTPDMSDDAWRDMIIKHIKRLKKEVKLENACREIYNKHVGSDVYKGKLWALSGVAVQEQYRRRQIGSTLVRIALSHIPDGEYVLIEAESSIKSWYERFGFKQSPVEGAQFNEFELGGKKIRVHVMLYEQKK
ncbi:hypothetical protein GGS20DRAFT_446496 [Poronia punctata]|nr:hypothetical protein GGS20DRAFT_446496 [Poronia punctata]